MRLSMIGARNIHQHSIGSRKARLRNWFALWVSVTGQFYDLRSSCRTSAAQNAFRIANASNCVPPQHASRPHQRWDIARFTTKVIQSPNRYSKKTLTLAAEKLSAAEIADRLGAVSGKEITVEYLPDLVARALWKQGNEVVGA
ncbi:uncharacterized protein EAE98_008059 [Botrytis deweyae]|uniref:Uncharacterized protein n=1 Tax=Botrytis deweyae TaxID=2478750 RepID=A0ABQ7IFJ6_9HELO|nr:uncharacterized protein EAE98_008059 [Botrytis deweyae]KAF7922533.1 hypothetical protein EAE98_008059 [Botrytis deweyae]